MTIDIVTMENKETGAETRVVRSAFDRVWKDLGWSLKEEDAKTKKSGRRSSSSSDS